MYDDYENDVIETERPRPETLKLMNRIKDELFGLRGILHPILRDGKLSEQTIDKQSDTTPIINELNQVLEIISALKRDIKL